MIFFAQLPRFFGTRFDARFTRHDDDRAVGDAHRFVHFAGKIEIAGSVEDIEFIIVPLDGNERGSDRYAALLLFFRKIADGVFVFNAAEPRRQFA